MKEFIHLIGVMWKERGNRNCRAKYRRMSAEMDRWKAANKKKK